MTADDQEYLQEQMFRIENLQYEIDIIECCGDIPFDEIAFAAMCRHRIEQIESDIREYEALPEQPMNTTGQTG